MDNTPASPTAQHALVLFGHGSRDPLWHQPIEALARVMGERAPATPVRCAYLELSQPDLPHVAAQLVAQGVRHITIFPMFLGVGRHAREDLPELVAQLRLSHPGLELRLMPAVGEHAQVIDLLASIALQAVASP
jgi:sirohydrochlorin cobaltochelatase